jgi:tRNA threonylcarbamoyladenosine modification (KEOPS) complex  Pcc1 subunit
VSSAKDMGDAVARVVWTGSREVAENLLESIMPDDPESFESEIVESEDGVSLTILISSSELSELRATVDDILACLSAVEGSLEVLGEEL